MDSSWKPISLPAFIGATTGLLFVGYVLFSPDGYVRILDDANLVFHEAGHSIFGILGSTLGLYGGTLGQLVFPAVISVEFWRRSETTAFIIGWWWLCENLLNIARYMADARTQILPLVGGGEHDWTTIFMRWGVLPHDTFIAGMLRLLAWLGIVFSWVWMAKTAGANYREKEGKGSSA